MRVGGWGSGPGQAAEGGGWKQQPLGRGVRPWTGQLAEDGGRKRQPWGARLGQAGRGAMQEACAGCRRWGCRSPCPLGFQEPVLGRLPRRPQERSRLQGHGRGSPGRPRPVHLARGVSVWCLPSTHSWGPQAATPVSFPSLFLSLFAKNFSFEIFLKNQLSTVLRTALRSEARRPQGPTPSAQPVVVNAAPAPSRLPPTGNGLSALGAAPEPALPAPR